MLANALTKHDANDEAFGNLLQHGWWQINGTVRIRQSNRVAAFEEADLHDMRKANASHEPFKTQKEQIGE